jgi:hypothetical protein
MDRVRGWKHHEYVCEDLGARRVREDPAAGAASQIAADCDPEVYDEGFWSRVSAWAGQFGLTGSTGIVRASGMPGAG